MCSYFRILPSQYYHFFAKKIGLIKCKGPFSLTEVSRNLLLGCVLPVDLGCVLLFVVACGKLGIVEVYLNGNINACRQSI